MKNRKTMGEIVLEVIPQGESNAVTTREIIEEINKLYPGVYSKNNITPVPLRLFRDKEVNRKPIESLSKKKTYLWWKDGSSKQGNITQCTKESINTRFVPYKMDRGKLLEIAILNNNEIVQVLPVANGTEFSLDIPDFNLSSINWKQHRENILIDELAEKSLFKKDHMRVILNNLTSREKDILKAIREKPNATQYQILEVVDSSESYIDKITKDLLYAGLITKSNTAPRKFNLTVFGTEVCAKLFGVEVNIDSGLGDTVRGI